MGDFEQNSFNRKEGTFYQNKHFCYICIFSIALQLNRMVEHYYKYSYKIHMVWMSASLCCSLWRHSMIETHCAPRDENHGENVFISGLENDSQSTKNETYIDWVDIEQCIRLPPGNFAPSNFVKDAYQKDESVTFGKSFINFSPFWNSKTFCVFAKP